MKPLVSVILPTYNRQHLISSAIKSVLKQTEKNLELIVINDGSKDQTKSVLNKLAKRDKRITVVNIRRQGHAAARNVGISKSRGEYVAFLDDDDTWLSSKLKKQLKLFQASPYKKNLGLVYCFHYWIDADGNRLGKNKITEKGNVFSKVIKSNIICGSGSSVLAKKSCFNLVGSFDEKLTSGADWEMWIRLTQQYLVDYVPEYLVEIRSTNHSVTSKNSNFISNSLRIYVSIIKLLFQGKNHASVSMILPTISHRFHKDLEAIWFKKIIKQKPTYK